MAAHIIIKPEILNIDSTAKGAADIRHYDIIISISPESHPGSGWYRMILNQRGRFQISTRRKKTVPGFLQVYK